MVSGESSQSIDWVTNDDEMLLDKHELTKHNKIVTVVNCCTGIGSSVPDR